MPFGQSDPTIYKSYSEGFGKELPQAPEREDIDFSSMDMVSLANGLDEQTIVGLKESEAQDLARRMAENAEATEILKRRGMHKPLTYMGSGMRTLVERAQRSAGTLGRPLSGEIALSLSNPIMDLLMDLEMVKEGIENRDALMTVMGASFIAIPISARPLYDAVAKIMVKDVIAAGGQVTQKQISEMGQRAWQETLSQLPADQAMMAAGDRAKALERGLAELAGTTNQAAKDLLAKEAAHNRFVIESRATNEGFEITPGLKAQLEEGPGAQAVGKELERGGVTTVREGQAGLFPEDIVAPATKRVTASVVTPEGREGVAAIQLAREEAELAAKARRDDIMEDVRERGIKDAAEGKAAREQAESRTEDIMKGVRAGGVEDAAAGKAAREQAAAERADSQSKQRARNIRAQALAKQEGAKGEAALERFQSQQRAAGIRREAGASPATDTDTMPQWAVAAAELEEAKGIQSRVRPELPAPAKTADVAPASGAKRGDGVEAWERLNQSTWGELGGKYKDLLEKEMELMGRVPARLHRGETIFTPGDMDSPGAWADNKWEHGPNKGQRVSADPNDPGYAPVQELRDVTKERKEVLAALEEEYKEINRAIFRVNNDPTHGFSPAKLGDGNDWYAEVRLDTMKWRLQDIEMDKDGFLLGGYRGDRFFDLLGDAREEVQDALSIKALAKFDQLSANMDVVADDLAAAILVEEGLKAKTPSSMHGGVPGTYGAFAEDDDVHGWVRYFWDRDRHNLPEGDPRHGRNFSLDPDDDTFVPVQALRDATKNRRELLEELKEQRDELSRHYEEVVKTQTGDQPEMAQRLRDAHLSTKEAEYASVYEDLSAYSSGAGENVNAVEPIMDKFTEPLERLSAELEDLRSVAKAPQPAPESATPWEDLRPAAKAPKAAPRAAVTEDMTYKAPEQYPSEPRGATTAPTGTTTAPGFEESWAEIAKYSRSPEGRAAAKKAQQARGPAGPGILEQVKAERLAADRLGTISPQELEMGVLPKAEPKPKAEPEVKAEKPAAPAKPKKSISKWKEEFDALSPDEQETWLKAYHAKFPERAPKKPEKKGWFARRKERANKQAVLDEAKVEDFTPKEKKALSEDEKDAAGELARSRQPKEKEAPKKKKESPAERERRIAREEGQDTEQDFDDNAAF